MRRDRLVTFRVGICVLASWAAMAEGVQADDPAAADGMRTELDLETALTLAESGSPRLRTAEARLEGARFGVVTARQYPNPAAFASSGRQIGRLPGQPNGLLGMVELEQPIDLPIVRRPRIRGAEASAVASELALVETQLMLRANVKQAFFDSLRRRAEFELSSKNQSVFEEIRNRVAVQVEVGESPRFELTRADAELSTAVNLTNSARIRVAQSIALLRAAIGSPLPNEIVVVGELGDPDPLPALSRVRDEALTLYPAISRANAAVEAAKAKVATERALRIAQPSVRAGFEREPQIDNYRLGISIPIPILNQRQGQIGEALAALQEATLAAEQTRIEVRAAVESAYNRYEVALAQIAQFEGGLLRQAETALAVAEAAYRFGERGLMDVLDAQRVLRTVRNDFLAARFDRQAALVEIERLRADGLGRSN